MTARSVPAFLERWQILDRPAGAARDAVRSLLRNRTVKDALHGVWFGHPLHPALAQFALGSYLSASVLDATGRPRRESSTLIGAGLAATLPTVASGWADYADAHEEQQRVGVVHAAANGAAVACYVTALAARSRGGSGRVASVLGGALAGLGAYLGGHLAYRQALGANHIADVPHTGPEDWQPLGALADLPDGDPARRWAGDTPVLVVRRGDDVRVLSDRCPHLASPMSDGELDCARGEITCPWHGSVFRVDDGAVVNGPATAPLAAFASRVVDGEVQARVLTFPGVPAS